MIKIQKTSKHRSTRKFNKLIVLYLIFCFANTLCQGQFVEPKAEIPQKKEGVYLKVCANSRKTFEVKTLQFTDLNNSNLTLFELKMGPGGGLSFGLGVGFSNEKMDFEFMIEESIIFGFESSYSSTAGSWSYSSSFFKTYLSGNMFYKIPIGKVDQHDFRIGGGPDFVVPGKFQVTLDGDLLGYANYQNAAGGHVDANWVINLSKSNLVLNPGIRIRIGQLHVKENTFNENQEQLSNLNISGLDLYFAFLF